VILIVATSTSNGTAAIPFDVVGPNGARKLIFAIGKTGEAYLLDRDNLGGVGGAVANARVTTNIAITSPAVWSAADGVLVVLQGDGADCPRGESADGLIALKIRVDPAPVIETAWCGSVAHAGSPIVTTTDGRSDPIVLVVGAEGDNRLHAFRADSGEPLATPPDTMRDFAPFSDAHRRRRPALCRRRRHDLRIRVLKDPSAHAVLESRICRLEGPVCECLPSAN
jgi:hypothetical protein